MAQRPPRVPGTATPRLRDAVPMTWWAFRSFAHAARNASTRAGRRHYVLLTAFAYGALPVQFVAYAAATACKLLSRRRRWYMTPDRAAVMCLQAATDDTWRAVDHMSAHIGSGTGRGLRRQVLESVLPLVDDAGIALEITASDEKLAQAYAAEILGLVDVGAAPHGGRRLRREAAEFTCEEQARVKRVLDDVVLAMGITEPVELAFTHAVDSALSVEAARRSRPARIEVPILVARRSSNAALGAALTHECAHLTYSDLGRLKVSPMKLLAVVGPVLAFYAAAVRPADEPSKSPLLQAAAVAVLALLAAAVGYGHRHGADALLRTRRLAAQLQLRELRCDLVGARRFGPAATVEALRLVGARDDLPERRNWFSPFSTHPATSVRIAAVEAYDRTEDPQKAAERLLGEQLTYVPTNEVGSCPDTGHPDAAVTPVKGAIASQVMGLRPHP